MFSAPFAKMNGVGNSILVLDLRGSGAAIDGAIARRLARDPRLRFDQLMAISEPRRTGTVAFVDIFNVDGSRAGACGNGTRCVAWVLSRGRDGSDMVVETAAGLLPCHKDADTVFTVDMGPPRTGWADIPLSRATDTADVLLLNPADPAYARCTAVSMGNPHAVFFVPDTETVPLAQIGPAVEHDPIFPDRVNASFAEIQSRTAVRLKVWERGAGATLACGSAACATLVAAVQAGLTDRTARISLPGGDLTIAWRAEDGHVLMTGGVELEHEGVLDLSPKDMPV